MPVNDFEIGEEMHEFITYSPEPEASSFQNNEVDKENDNNAETNISKRQKTNADKQHEKTALFKRYVEAMEKSNVIQERLVKIKEENQLIKRKTLELAEYKYALKKRKYDETTGNDKEALRLKKMNIEIKLNANLLKTLELEKRF